MNFPASVFSERMDLMRCNLDRLKSRLEKSDEPEIENIVNHIKKLLDYDPLLARQMGQAQYWKGPERMGEIDALLGQLDALKSSLPPQSKAATDDIAVFIKEWNDRLIKVKEHILEWHRIHPKPTTSQKP